MVFEIIITVLLVVCILLLAYYVKESKKQKKSLLRRLKFYEERMTEIETYAYTDIRELNEVLELIKEKYGITLYDDEV